MFDSECLLQTSNMFDGKFYDICQTNKLFEQTFKHTPHTSKMFAQHHVWGLMFDSEWPAYDRDLQKIMICME